MDALSDDFVISFLMEKGYLHIAEFAKLRQLSTAHRDCIDYWWKHIERAFLNRIGPDFDINIAADIVIRNETLLMKVLDIAKPATGYVLYMNGMVVYSKVHILLPKSKLADLIEKRLDFPDVNRMMNMHRHAYYQNLPEFKKYYYKDDENMWNLIFHEYISGVINRNTMNYQINWAAVKDWNNTPFFKFISGAIKYKNYVQIINVFSELSIYTKQRECNNIVKFIEELFDPIIDHERRLLRKLRKNQPIHGTIIGYNNKPKRRYNDPHKMCKEQIDIIVESSVMRHILAPAAFNTRLFSKYLEIANDEFDLTNDKIIKTLPKVIMQAQYYECVPIFTKYYKLPLNSFSYLGIAAGKIHPSAVCADQLNAHTLLKLAIVRCDNLNNIEQPEEAVYPLITSDSAAALGVKIPWMTRAQCEKILNNMRTINITIPKYYEVFLTRDLAFWITFVEEFRDYLENNRYLIEAMFIFHINLLNVDIARYILMDLFTDPEIILLFSPEYKHGIISELLYDVAKERNFILQRQRL